MNSNQKKKNPCNIYRADHLFWLTVIYLSKLSKILYQSISRQNRVEKKMLSKLYILLTIHRPFPHDL